MACVVASGWRITRSARTMARLHLLRRVGDKYREVTSTVDWPTFHGDMSGNRYTTMTQITKDNVKNLGAKWVYTIRNAQGLQDTPQVVGGIMYVTNVNTCIALDAGTGRQLWQWNRPAHAGCDGRRFESRRGGGRRSRVHRDRHRASRGAESFYRRQLFGKPRWRTGIRITARRARRWRWAIW